MSGISPKSGGGISGTRLSAGGRSHPASKLHSRAGTGCGLAGRCLVAPRLRPRRGGAPGPQHREDERDDQEHRAQDQEGEVAVQRLQPVDPPRGGRLRATARCRRPRCRAGGSPPAGKALPPSGPAALPLSRPQKALWRRSCRSPGLFARGIGVDLVRRQGAPRHRGVSLRGQGRWRGGRRAGEWGKLYASGRYSLVG
jgi:hypothetical protein